MRRTLFLILLSAVSASAADRPQNTFWMPGHDELYTSPDFCPDKCYDIWDSTKESFIGDPDTLVLSSDTPVVDADKVAAKKAAQAAAKATDDALKTVIDTCRAALRAVKDTGTITVTAQRCLIHLLLRE